MLNVSVCCAVVVYGNFFVVAFFGILLLVGYKLYVQAQWDFIENFKMLAIVAFHVFLIFYSLSIMKKGWLSQLKNVTRSTVFLTVQKGCNNSCAYCVVPLSGNSESDTLTNIVNNAKILEEEGVKEIVLRGGNIGDFGTGEHGNLKHDHTFLEMLHALDSVGGIERFRIASITTPMISVETLEFINNSLRFAPHFDIRMHSASDDMLKIMDRPYQRAPYKALIERIKKVIPNAFISVKIIVGHPGETEALFQETVDFLNDADISFIEVFPFKKKSKTPASYVKEGLISRDVSLKRKKILTAIADEKRTQFYHSQIDSTIEVLFEMQNRNEFIYGYTENYIRVKTTWKPELLNTVHKVKLTAIGSDGIGRFDFIQEKEIEVQEHFTI